METNVLSDRFKVFANRECKGSSKLYETLSLSIADDIELLLIAANSREGQPIPNLFLGSVHYLLLKGINHELKEYYSSIVSNPREPRTAFAPFRDFCLLNKTAIIHLLKTKLVQTNEVRRCAYLYPSFCRIYNKADRPLALIEIGTSAGLQLLWDQYSYSYNSTEVYGNTHSTLKIESEIQGEKSPFLLKNTPPVTSRIGIDLHINDLKHPESYLWLKALIWPEHKERIIHFEQAVECLKDEPLELIEGDGVKLLPEIVSRIPLGAVVCIFHTHVANQIPLEGKHELLELIRNIGQKRDVFHLYNNMWDSALHLDYYLDGEEFKETLAETEGHGRWFQWML
jgi:hypothetical protein